MKIKDLVGDLTYKEIKERKWKHPRMWRNEKRLLFTDYLISYDGIILRRTWGKNTFPGKKMKSHVNFDGYSVINLFINGKRYPTISIHRLLWETWKGRIPKGLETNHKYGIKTDNDLEKDLEIITHLENIRHAKKMGLNYTKEHREKHSKRMSGENHPMYGKHRTKETRKKISKSNKGKQAGENHPRSKLSQKEVNQIRYLSYIKKWNILNIADKFRVSGGCIDRIVRGRDWNPKKLTKEELIEKCQKEICQ